MVRDTHVAFQIPSRQQRQVIRNHENIHVCNIRQGEDALRRIYKRLKFGGGQAYDSSSDSIAVVAGATFDWT
jgi:hypothetical protein